MLALHVEAISANVTVRPDAILAQAAALPLEEGGDSAPPPRFASRRLASCGRFFFFRFLNALFDIWAEWGVRRMGRRGVASSRRSFSRFSFFSCSVISASRSLFAFFATATVLRFPIESIGFLLSMTFDTRTAVDRLFGTLPENGARSIRADQRNNYRPRPQQKRP